VKSEISVLIADDNAIVREGVKSILEEHDDLNVVGVAEDLASLRALAEELRPQVVVTDIRMPPRFATEGIDGALEIKKTWPETAIVILSQYDDPNYAISLFRDGARGCGYILKERIVDGDQLANAVRQVAIGGTWIDPRIVKGMLTPVSEASELSATESYLLDQIAAGRSVSTIAAASDKSPSEVAVSVERLFLTLARQADGGTTSALDRLKMLHYAVVERQEFQESLTRFLPEGVAQVIKAHGVLSREPQLMDVTVLMSDIRGYSMIAEQVHASTLATMLSDHRRSMSEVVSKNQGTVMNFAGDAVMAVFGAPVPLEGHADHAFRAAKQMQLSQMALNERWESQGLRTFALGIGLSTGEVAAGLLGSEDRMEYSVVGSAVNLAQRLQGWAAGSEIVISQPTYNSLQAPEAMHRLEPRRVKGTSREVVAYKYFVK